jgi:protocatechuate 3,4-dioxygenase beta subunit
MDIMKLIFSVVDGSSGRPVADAEIRVAQYFDEPQDQRTDHDGLCRIELTEAFPGQFCVIVQKSGFVPVRVLWDFSPQSPLPAEYVLRLEKGTAIGGQVHDEAGRPISGATVLLMLWERGRTENGANVGVSIMEATATTDAEGRWRFDQAPVSLAGLRYRLKHPDFVEEFRFSKADIPEEQFREGNAILVMKTGIRVEGTVTDQAGQPVADAELLTGKDRFCSGSKPSYRTDAAGRFSFVHAPEARVSLTVKSAGHAPALAEFPVMAGMAPLRIVVGPGRSLRVRVVDATGAALAATYIFADTWRRHRSLEWHTKTGADGRFTWDCAPPDEVLFDFLKTGCRNARRVPLTASDEEQMVVLLKPLSLSGRVTEAQTGAPIEAFRLISGYAFANQRICWRWEHAVAFSDGHYEAPFKHDRQGDRKWFLRVEAEGYRPAVSEIDESREALTLDFALEPGPTAAARVLTPDGVPAADATLAVVLGTPASLDGDKLDAGRGNLVLCSAADGTFSFPAQEPPYAIVAVHSVGCAIATAEQFARNPTIRLEGWGRLEIISDGAAAGEPIPFRLIYPDLPRDDRMLWVMIRTQPKRIGNRIVFEKLAPGRVLVARSGQAGHESIETRIKPSEAITLDFDRGVGADGETLPGMVAVKVVDEQGSPVEGATVVAESYSIKGPPGTSISIGMSESPPRKRVTNRLGVAAMSYPQNMKVRDRQIEPSTRSPAAGQSSLRDRILADREIAALSLVVRHPDFCTARSRIPIAGEALPVVLKRGAMVKLTSTAGEHVYPQVLSPEHGTEVDPDTWAHEEGCAVANRLIPPGRHYIRLVSFPERFSEVVELNVQSGDAREFRLDLKPGIPFTGNLDARVPRPVLNGRVEANVLTLAENAEEPMQWHVWTEARPDGSFSFEALPPGKVEVTVLCDGFVSKSGRTPQAFEQGAGAVVAMEPAASLRLKVTDTAGKPLAGARVMMNPNVTWAGRYSTLFAGGQLSTPESLRLDSEGRRERQKGLGWGLRFQATTDESGEAVITNLPAGKQRFHLHCEGYEPENMAAIPGLREVEMGPGEVKELAVVLHAKGG